MSRTTAPRMVMLVVAALLATTSYAAADKASQVDPDDTGGPLDIAEVGHGHRQVQGRVGPHLKHWVRTHEPWDPEVLQDSGRLFFGFDTDGDRGSVERVVSIQMDEGVLYGRVTSARGVIGYTKVERTNRRTVRVIFPRRLLGKGVRSYRWNSYSSFQEADHPECAPTESCFDIAPNRRLIRH